MINTDRLRTASTRAKVREVANAMFGPDIGCADGACVYGHRGGMQTNSGCQCLKSRSDFELSRNVQLLSRIALKLAEESVAANLRIAELRQSLEVRDTEIARLQTDLELACAQITTLCAHVVQLAEALSIFCHAHDSGNSVPPHIRQQARNALAKAGAL